MDTNKIKTLLKEVKEGTKTEDDVNKEIMAAYGTAIKAEQGKATANQNELDEAKTKIGTYETEIKNLKDSLKDSEELKTKFENLESKVAADNEAAKLARADENLTNNIINAFGDKKFTSEYVKNGLVTDIKTELSKPENEGKGISEIFDTLTKDKAGIFENPNTPADMPDMGEGGETPSEGAEGFVSIIQENQRK